MSSSKGIATSGAPTAERQKKMREHHASTMFDNWCDTVASIISLFTLIDIHALHQWIEWMYIGIHSQE
jgi:hypothetical protein